MSDNIDFPPPPDWDDEDDPFWGLYGSEEEGEDPTSAYIDVHNLLAEFGIEDAAEFLVDIQDVHLEDLRGVVFGSLEEAISFLIEIGVILFAEVVYVGDDEFMVAIPEDTP